MSLNNVEIEKILMELDLNGAVLQKVKPIDFESFTFFFYKPGNPINVQISLDKNCRIHRQTKKIEYLGKTHNLVEFLKAYIVGGYVRDIKQIDKNRIIQIKISKDDKKYILFIRLWGGFSNIIITTEDYTILHLHKKSSKKAELQGLKLILPPPLNSDRVFKLKDHNYPDYNSFIEFEYINILKTEREEKEQLNIKHYRSRRKKEINNQLKKLERRLEGYSKSDMYKLYADLITSNIFKIKKGDTTLNVIDYTTGDSVEIPIDPGLEPHKNSEVYYKKNKKAVAGFDKTEGQISLLKEERDNLELALPQTVIKSSKKIEVNKPGLNYNSSGWEILVGRNAKENEALLRSYVKGNDMWLHVRDFPGGYVFIKYKKNKTFPLQILMDAGILALYYSKGKNNCKADIKYTQVKYLRKIKKGKPGQVIATNDKNIYVTLDKNRLKALKP